MSHDSSGPFDDSNSGPGPEPLPAPPPTPTHAPVRVPIHTPQDLLTAIPYLLRYHPGESLVVAFSQRDRIIATVTVNCSPAEANLDLWQAISSQLQTCRPDSLYLVAYVPDNQTAVLREYARTAPLPLKAVLRVHQGRWWGLRLDQATYPICCPSGHRCEVQDHVVAPLTVAGCSIVPSLDDLSDCLNPAPKDVLDRVHDEIVAQARGDQAATDRYRALWSAHEARTDGPVKLSESDAALLLTALSHPRVRDACLDWHDDASWWLWSELMPLTPGAWVPTVASLLSAAAYQRGDPDLAFIAAQYAVLFDPLCPHARAVLIGLAGDLPGEDFAQAARTIAAGAREHLRTHADPDNR